MAPPDVLTPETAYGGITYPIAPHRQGAATQVNQLRDPYVVEGEGQTRLFNTIAGETGIAVAALDIRMPTETDP